MRTPKKRIELQIPFTMFERWIRSRKIEYGEVTKRLKQLIASDTNLSDEEITVEELNIELKNIDKEIDKFEIQKSTIIANIKLLKNRNYEDELKMKRQKLQLAKEMRRSGLI